MIVPNRLLIELTNRCNAKCTYCMRNLLRRPVFDLPLDDFKKWVKSAPFCPWVQTQGIGEPLLYPHEVEALGYCKSQKKKTMFYTNASLLTPSMSERILDTGLNSLTFSVDGYNEDTFSPRVGLSWSRVLRNIVTFQRLRDRGGYATTTTIRATITDANKWRIPQYFMFWKGKVDKVGMMREVYFPPPQVLDKTRWARGDEGFRCFHIFEITESKRQTRLVKTDRATPAITVLNDGNVVVCCQDWFNHYIMGNLYEDKILDAFNSEAYRRIRKGMMSGGPYPYLCEFCKLGKWGKRFVHDPFQITARFMSADQYRGKYFSVAKALLKRK